MSAESLRAHEAPIEVSAETLKTPDAPAEVRTESAKALDEVRAEAKSFIALVEMSAEFIKTLEAPAMENAGSEKLAALKALKVPAKTSAKTEALKALEASIAESTALKTAPVEASSELKTLTVPAAVNTVLEPLEAPVEVNAESESSDALEVPEVALETTSEPESSEAALKVNAEKTKKPSHKSSRESVGRELLSLALKIGVIAGIVLMLFSFVFGLHYNTDADMHPAVKDGDLVMFNRWDKEFHVGDLAVLTYQGHMQVRRVIATSGDTVDIIKEGLLINGALLQERDITEITQRYVGGIDFPITLEENEIFVLGDARAGATDSRIYGAVHTDDTHGIVLTLFRRRGL